MMQKVISKVTKKYQATIPAVVRKKLHLGVGDMITFELSGQDIIIHKATAMDKVFIAALSETLNEWNSDADEDAFRDL